MSIVLFEMIKPAYPNVKACLPVSQAGVEHSSPELPDLSRHLLRDIGLLDGPDRPECRAEPPRSARDLVDRYR